MRNMFAASFPLFANYMFNGMGYQWACTLLALIAVICVPLPYILFFKGETIRSRSSYASGQTGLKEQNDVEKVSNASSN